MVMAIISVKSSLWQAEKFAHYTAINIQRKCISDNICPEYIPGWNRRDDSFVCDSLAGGLAKYRVLYGVNDDRKEYTVMLRINIDRHLDFYGGVGKEMQRALHES